MNRWRRLSLLHWCKTSSGWSLEMGLRDCIKCNYKICLPAATICNLTVGRERASWSGHDAYVLVWMQRQTYSISTDCIQVVNHSRTEQVLSPQLWIRTPNTATPAVAIWEIRFLGCGGDENNARTYHVAGEKSQSVRVEKIELK